MFDCFGVRFAPHFQKKPSFQNGQKSQENRTNMDVNSSSLAKPEDKRGITLCISLICPYALIQRFYKSSSEMYFYVTFK